MSKRNFSLVLRFNVILIFVCFRRSLDGITLPDYCYVTLHVAFGASVDVVRIRQHRPFVVKLVICKWNGKRDETTGYKSIFPIAIWFLANFGMVGRERCTP